MVEKELVRDSNSLNVNRSLVSKLTGLLWRTTRQLIKFKNVNFKGDTKCQIQISTNY